MPTRPNILMIVVDCARADRLLGPDRTARAPTIDRLAAGGATFDTMIVETPATTPAFASMLTGAYSFRHGVASVGGYRVAGDLATLPEVLRSAGYHTYAEVTGPLVPPAGLTRGFDEYNYRVAFDYLHTDWGARFRARLASGGYRAPWFILLHLWELHVERQVLDGFDAPSFGRDRYDRAVSSLDAQVAEVLAAAVHADPLVVLTGDHGEKTLRETYRAGTAVDYARKLYAVDRGSRFGVRQAAMLAGPVAMQQLRVRFQPRLEAFSQRETPRPLAPGWWTQMRDVLAFLRLGLWLRPSDLPALRRPGQFTELLERRGALDPEQCRARIERLERRIGEERLFDLYLRMWIGQFRKQLDEGHVLHVYDYLVRVPFILHVPGGQGPAGRTSRLVRQVDLAATLLDAIGVDSGTEFAPDGRSALPLVDPGRRGAEPERVAFLSVSGQPSDVVLRGLRTDAWKYTYGWANPELPRELYDLCGDPQEARNVAAEQPGRCAALEQTAEATIPAGGPRIERADDLTPEEQQTLELRLRELGYVE